MGEIGGFDRVPRPHPFTAVSAFPAGRDSGKPAGFTVANAVAKRADNHGQQRTAGDGKRRTYAPPWTSTDRRGRPGSNSIDLRGFFRSSPSRVRGFHVLMFSRAIGFQAGRQHFSQLQPLLRPNGATSVGGSGHELLFFAYEQGVLDAQRRQWTAERGL